MEYFARNKVMAIGVLLSAIFAIGGAWIWYDLTRTANDWVACGGSQNKSLISASDNEYWDEVFGSDFEADQVASRACISYATVESIEVDWLHGSAKVTGRSEMPVLSPEELTEFPLTATIEEKIAMLRERAASKEVKKENLFEFEMKFERFSWVVMLHLKELAERDRNRELAESLRKNGRYEAALAVYDKILLEVDLDAEEEDWLRTARMNIYAEKACKHAIEGQEVFPLSVRYELTGFATSVSADRILVMGTVLAPESYGVNGEYVVKCVVELSKDKPSAIVGFELINRDPRKSIRKNEISVSL